MLRRLFAVAATALALLLVAGTFETAEARRGGGHGFHGGRAMAFSGRAFSGHRVHVGRAFSGHRFRGRHLAVGVPLAYGAYYYSDGCYWLKRRALATGSGYWWDRYYACVEGYY
jgi:hypothetical protein